MSNSIGYQKLGIDSRVLVTTGCGLREQELKEHGVPCWRGLSEDTLQEILQWNPEVVHIHSHAFGEPEMDFLDKIFPGRTVVEKNILQAGYMDGPNGLQLSAFHLVCVALL
jgi:hypothetical protein